jgi:hypothetical protein
MKGVFFTAITFIIFLGVLAYILTITSSNVERGTLATERISANRIYYTWKSVHDNFEGLLNISSIKNGSTAVFNDSLPAVMDIKNMLWVYQNFIEEFYNDGTMSVRFEDPSGNPVDLNDTEPKITIKPMNINYSWPDYGKNRLFIKVDESNFSFIENVSIYFEMKNVDLFCRPIDPLGPSDCDKWSPDRSVATCSGAEFNCLTLNLSFEDQQDRVFNSAKHYFNLDDPSGSSLHLKVKNDTANYDIDVKIGPLPLVIDIQLKNTLVDTDTKLKLNTTEFYINYAAILNVTTPYGKMVGNL